MTIRRPARLILLAAWLVFVLYAYPGYMTTSAVDQLVDARVGSFTDWAPPLMTELWRVIGFVCAGPAGLLLLQGTVTLLAAYHLLRGTFTDRAAAAWAAAVLLMPPILATVGVIWPQSLVLALGLAAAALFRARDRRVQLLALPLVFLACGMHDGAAAAMLPLVVGCCELRRWSRRWLRYPVAFLIWCVLAGSAGLVGNALVDAHTHRDDLALAMDDTVGTIAEAGTLTDAAVRAELADVPLAASSDLQQAARGGREHPDRFFRAPLDKHEVRAVLRARLTLRRDLPRAYLAQRWRVAKRTLGLHRPRTWLAVYRRFLGTGRQEAAVQHTASHSFVQTGLGMCVVATSHTLLFHPYLYALLALILLPLAVRWRSHLAATLLASGLVGELAMLVTAERAEVRYSIWLIATTVIAVPLVIAARIQRDATRP